MVNEMSKKTAEKIRVFDLRIFLNRYQYVRVPVALISVRTPNSLNKSPGSSRLGGVHACAVVSRTIAVRLPTNGSVESR